MALIQRSQKKSRTICQSMALRQRKYRRIYRHRQRVNNETLRRIENLPLQQNTNDILINQFFNGSPFP
jgi:hypothetical protein